MSRSNPKLCLAGSGGGHLRQLLDLEPVWSRYDHFFVTEPSAIADDLAMTHRVYLVRHYAAGQAKLGKPVTMMASALANMWQSLKIVIKERPDVIVSTGAGAMFWTALFARILGAKFVLIDSFARFDAPSKFAKLSKPFASEVVIQSPTMAELWPDAHMFDPLRMLEGKGSPKDALTLATVGATLPFDRMSEAVLALYQSGAVTGDLIIQTGIGSAVAARGEQGDALRIVETLPFAEMQTILEKADVVICHGGTGSFITALRQGCRVVAMPRLFERGEHYDNHQFEISTAFAARGLVEVALEVDDLAPAIARTKTKEPRLATTDPAALNAWLGNYVARLG